MPTETLNPSSRHGRITAVSMMKDEAPFVLEWVAHHLAVGFTDLLIYTNDCTDGTDDMLIRLQDLGLAHHRRNTIPNGVKPQPSALKHAQTEPLVEAADWLMVFDADEFLCLSHPSGTLDGLLDDVTARGANGIVVTWRIFGSAGIVDWNRAPVTEQYLRSAPPLWNKGWGVKTLFRFDPTYWKLGIHRPAIKNKWLETDFPGTVRWLNGSGDPMEDYFKFRGWRSIRRTFGDAWAQMNHYAVKSVDSYALRKLRGNVNNKADKYNADYWALQDRNEIEDRKILRHAPRRAEIMAQLLADPTLNRLHHAALEQVEARLADYRQTDDYAAFRDGLLAAGQTPISQVVAKPPKARDPARIAELMARVEGPAATPTEVPAWATADGDPYLPGPHVWRNVSGTQWHTNHDIDLPADPALFTPEALDAVIAGRFERRHARHLPGLVKGHARLLDIGAGIGFLALRALQTCDGLTCLAQDDRAGLMAAARTVADRAGFAADQRLGLDDRPLTAPDSLAALIGTFQPDCLRLSRPAEAPALAGLDLSSVRRVLIPALTEDQQAEHRATFGPALASLGLSEQPDRISTGSLVFDRTA